MLLIILFYFLIKLSSISQMYILVPAFWNLIVDMPWCIVLTAFLNAVAMETVETIITIIIHNVHGLLPEEVGHTSGFDFHT